MTSPRGVRKRLNLPTDLSTPDDARSLLCPLCLAAFPRAVSSSLLPSPPLSLSSLALYEYVDNANVSLLLVLLYPPLACARARARSRLHSRMDSVDSLHSTVASMRTTNLMIEYTDNRTTSVAELRDSHEQFITQIPHPANDGDADDEHAKWISSRGLLRRKKRCGERQKRATTGIVDRTGRYRLLDWLLD